MSVEQQWYRDFSDAGEPVKRRPSRMPMAVQWEACIGIAVALAKGAAGSRQVWVHLTGEQYWYWPDGDEEIPDTRARPKSKTSGWWLVPGRIAKRAVTVYEAARVCEGMRRLNDPSLTFQTYGEDVARRLGKWRRDGQWRRHVVGIMPRSAKRTNRRRASARPHHQGEPS